MNRGKNRWNGIIDIVINSFGMNVLITFIFGDCFYQILWLNLHRN